MPPVSDLVRDSKLETTFFPECTVHVYHIPGTTPRQRKLRKEERWQRDKNLGTGAFGTVWLEKSVTEDSEVRLRAVKEIRKIAQKSKAIDHSRELEAIAKFSHPKYESCFVKSFGWYENSLNVFIAMEYFPLGDLQSCLMSPIPEEEAQQITFQILEGLSFMHENGFAHRDLKPTNILVKCKGPDWWVKIGDFGISKRVEDGLTALRTLSGTLGFLAPEILGRLGIVDNDFEFSDEYTVAVDIWSLGQIAFLILTGKQPFPGPGFRGLKTYIKGTSSFPVDVLHAHGVSNEGCDILKSLMAPTPKNRLTAKEASRHKWIQSQKPYSAWSNVEMERPTLTTEEATPSPEYPTTEASARWTTFNDSVFQSGSLANLGSHIKSPATRQLVHSAVAESNPDISERWSALGELTFQPGTFPQRTLNGADASTAYYLPGGTPNNLDTAHQRIQHQRAQKTTDIALTNDTIGNARAELERSPTVKYQGRRKEAEEQNMPMVETKNGMVTQGHPVRRHMLQGLAATYRKLVKAVSQPAHRTLAGHSESVGAVAFSPDGKLVASGSDDGTVRLWDSATGAPRRTLAGHSDWVSAVAFSPDGKLVASGSGDGTVRLWDSATSAAHRTLAGHSDWVSAVAFSPNGKLVASGSGDGAVRLWDSATGAARRTLAGHSDWVSAVAFSPDGKLVASGSGDGTVRLSDSATGAARRTLAGHSGSVRAVAFSPDGKLVASSSGDGTVSLWDSATSAARRTLVGHSGSVSAVAFSPDGKLVASGSDDGTVRLWDSATGAARRTLAGHSGSVSAVAFSPDGKLVASGSDDSTVRLWDSATGAARRTLAGHSGSVSAVAFSPDGKLVASGSGDGTVRLWDSATGVS